MTTDIEGKDQMAAQSHDQEREIQKTRMAEHVAKLANEHPEADIASKGQFWVPSIDFTFDVKDRLPSATEKKLQSCLQRIIDEKYAPDVVGPAIDEAKGYLGGEGNEDLLARFDKIFGNMGFWDTMRKRALEKEKEKATVE